MNTIGFLLILFLGACASPEHHALGDLPSPTSALDASPSDAVPDAGLKAPSPSDARVATSEPDAGLDASKPTGPSSQRDAGDAGTPPILPTADAGSAPPTVTDDDAGEVSSTNDVDLLFVVDNSNSMAEKQASLKAALPELMRALTSGVRSSGGRQLPAVSDLHVGVVSTDMGTPGVELSGCDPNGGDDGRLQHTPHGAACQTTYPLFLSYDATTTKSSDTLAKDFECIALLGTGGCGIEQALESPLKALWPSKFIDGQGNVVSPNPVMFLSTTQAGTLGRGDVPVAQGGNLGFLRNAPYPSLIAIVVLTDEDDCSARSTGFLVPPLQLPSGSPYAGEDINLRCFDNPDQLFDVRARYLNAFRKLRQDPRRVVFGAIAGVPSDLIDHTIDPSDDAAREAYYQRLLDDPRMRPTPDPSTLPGTGTGNLSPSCVRSSGGGQPITAAPPVRLVQLAQAFGAQGRVASICQDDLTDAVDSIAELIGSQLLPAPHR